MYRIAIVDISYLKARMADEVAKIQVGQVEEIRIRLSLDIKTNKENKQENNSNNKTTEQ